MKYCKTLRSSLILAIFIMLAQVLSITNLSLVGLDQHAFGEISGNVTKLTENAVVLNSMGRFNDALSYLDQALSIDPNYVVALINKGISLDGLGRFDEEMMYYDKALSIDPNNKNAINNKGVCPDKSRKD